MLLLIYYDPACVHLATVRHNVDRVCTVFVLAFTAKEPIPRWSLTTEGNKNIVAIPAIHDIRARVSVQEVPARPPVAHVVAALTKEVVGSFGPPQSVGTASAYLGHRHCHPLAATSVATITTSTNTV